MTVVGHDVGEQDGAEHIRQTDIRQRRAGFRIPTAASRIVEERGNIAARGEARESIGPLVKAIYQRSGNIQEIELLSSHILRCYA